MLSCWGKANFTLWSKAPVRGGGELRQERCSPFWWLGEKEAEGGWSAFLLSLVHSTGAFQRPFTFWMHNDLISSLSCWRQQKHEQHQQNQQLRQQQQGQDESATTLSWDSRGWSGVISQCGENTSSGFNSARDRLKSFTTPSTGWHQRHNSHILGTFCNQNQNATKPTGIDRHQSCHISFFKSLPGPFGSNRTHLYSAFSFLQIIGDNFQSILHILSGKGVD